MMTKKCTVCEQEKPIFEFYRDQHCRDGYRSECRVCGNRKQAQWYRKNKKIISKRRKKQYQENPERRWNNLLYNKFGITAKIYGRILEQQRGVCAICGQPETQIIRGKTIRLAVDHDHKMGKVRGLLCMECNQGLGKFGDNAELMEKAAAYVRQHRKNS